MHLSFVQQPHEQYNLIYDEERKLLRAGFYRMP